MPRSSRLARLWNLSAAFNICLDMIRLLHKNLQYRNNSKIKACLIKGKLRAEEAWRLQQLLGSSTLFSFL